MPTSPEDPSLDPPTPANAPFYDQTAGDLARLRAQLAAIDARRIARLEAEERLRAERAATRDSFGTGVDE